MSITEPEIVVDRLEYYRRERQRMLEREIAAALGMEPTAWSTWKRSYLRDDILDEAKRLTMGDRRGTCRRVHGVAEALPGGAVARPS